MKGKWWLIAGIIGIGISLLDLPEVKGKFWIVPLQMNTSTLIAIVSLILALWGLYLEIRQIEFAKEVEVLEEMPEITTEIAKRIRKATRVFFMATTPAIGASGAPDEAKELEKILIDFSEEKKPKPQEMCFLCYNEDNIKRFYKDHGIPYDNTHVGQITKEIIGKIRTLMQANIARLFDVEYCKIPMLHFLLVDPESKSREKRLAVLWYLGPGDGEIKGTGFSTNNEAVIETLWRVFQRQREIVERKIDVCQSSILKQEK